MKQARGEYSQLIQKLYTCKEEYPESSMCIFNAKRGRQYANKLMVVGRAVNGWGDPTKNIVKQNNEEQPAFTESVLDYLETETTNFKEQMVATSKGYNHNTSAFTRLKRSIAAKLITCNKSEANCNIVWSNLYKVSPHDRGNPSDKLKKLQFDSCLSILKMEIEHYKPETIIFLTSYQKQRWAKPFLDRLEMVNMLQKPIGFVEFAGLYNSSKVVVGQHPQGKNETIHLNNIIEALSLIS